MVGVTDGGGTDQRAVPAATTTTARVLGTTATRTTATPTTAARVKPKATPAPRKVAAKPTLQPGTYAAENDVRVLDVVGPGIFWIGRSKASRTLVHLQGHGTRWGIRPGQRLTFKATVARNNTRAAARWGLSRREGRDQFSRQPYHFEVYGPQIRFLCVTRCSR